MPSPENTYMSRNEAIGTQLSSADELRDILDSAVPIFILVDPMLGEPLPSIEMATDVIAAQGSREAGWERAIQAVLLPARIALPPHLHPYLIALTGREDQLLDVTLEIAQSERSSAQLQGLEGEGGAAHRISGWLQSSMHVEELAQHLSQMFRVNTAATTSASYLRMVDRRTLALLRHFIRDDRLLKSFGRLQSWTYLDAFGDLAVLRNASDEHTPLRISIEEWGCLELGERINRALAQYLGELNKARTLCHPPDAHLYEHLALAALEASAIAKKWPHRFGGICDQTVWMALSILHPGLAKNCTVQNLMQDAGSDSQPADLLRFMHQQIRALA